MTFTRNSLFLLTILAAPALTTAGCAQTAAPAAGAATAPATVTRPTTARDSWSWEAKPSVKATLDFEDGIYRADVAEPSGTGWHAQLLQRDLTLTNGQNYVLRFRAQSPTARALRVYTGLDGEPWTNNGLNENVTLATDWKDYALIFTASNAAAKRTRLVFELGTEAGEVSLRDITLAQTNQKMPPRELTDLPAPPEKVLQEMPTYGAWQSSYIGGGGYILNVVPTSDPQIVYAQPDVCGAYRSDDGGQSWRMIHGTLPAQRGNQGVRGLVSDPRDPNFVAMAVGDQWAPKLGVFVSKDGGKSWNKTLDALVFGNGPGRWKGRTLVRDPNNVNRLVVATNGDGVFESLDNGQTWKSLGLKDLYPDHVQFDRANARRMWVCAGDFKNWIGDKGGEQIWKGAFYRTDDGGANWTKLGDKAPDEMVQDPKMDGRFYGIFDNKEIRVSDDGGATWRAMSAGLPDGFQTYALAAGPDFVLTSTLFSGGIYRLDAGGTTWKNVVREALQTEPYWWGPHGVYSAFGSSTSSLTVDTRDPKHWYLTDWFSVWQTRDAGANWSHTSQGLETTFVHNLTQDINDPTRVYAGLADLGMFISHDGGRSFERRTGRKIPLPGDNIVNNIKDISVSPANPQRLYAIGSKEWYSNSLFVSDNAGQSWKMAPLSGLPAVKDAHLSNHKSSTVAVSPTDANEVYLTLSGTIKDGDGGPYRSTDSGQTFAWAGAGLPATEFYRTNQAQHDSQLEVSSDGSMVTISVDKGLVYRRASADEAWQKVATNFGGAPYGVTADPHHAGRFYIGVKNAGLYRSDDGGRTWRKLNAPGVSYLEVDGAKADRLAAGTMNGVMLSRDGGETWVALDKSLPARVEWLELAFVGDRLLVGTGGSGVFWIDLPTAP